MPCHHMLMEKKKKYEKMKKLKEAREKSLNKAKESLNDRNLKSIITSEKLNNSTNIRSNVKDGHINNMDNIKEVPKITDLPKPEGLVSPDSKSDSSTQSYQGSIVSSFDFDDYALDSNDSKASGSSVYVNEQPAETEKASVERMTSSPVLKVEVRKRDETYIDANDAILKTPTLKHNESNNSTPKAIPIQKSSFNEDMNRFSFLHSEESNPDILIPLRSPKRTNVSPVKSTAQFRTPELETPKKNPIPIELTSPGSLHRKAHVIDTEIATEELEKEPESFIHLDETEEESMFSHESEAHNNGDVDDLSNENKLLSPIKYNFGHSSENTGLNIPGLDPKLATRSEVIQQINHKKVERMSSNDPSIAMSTPEQSSSPTFDTPNSRKKPLSGGLGRSLTKVFGRGKKSDENTPIDQHLTPETIVSRKSSITVANNTQRRHERTTSDQSFVAFSTPPIPRIRSHQRSISETTNFEGVDQVTSSERELNHLKVEINSLTLVKATLVRDIQNLKTQLQSLELDVSQRQKMIRDLDNTILAKQKLSSHEDLTPSTKSASSKQNSSKDELINPAVSERHALEEEIKPPSSTSSNAQSSQPPSSTTTKDKRGFMRRIFGNHSGQNSATSGPNTAANTPSVSNIGQPMNPRYNDENFFDHPKNVSNENLNNGMKSSRSANFMQWRNGVNGSTNGKPMLNNSSSNGGEKNNENLLYSMTLQELADSEGNVGVPFIVKTCIIETERRGIKVEGIYRISASSSSIEKLEQLFESLDVNNLTDINKMRSIVENGDIHAMAGLLKRYLKKIPDSIIPESLYDRYVAISKIENESAKLEALSNILLDLPNANRVTLLMITKHLALVAKNEKWNKMNSKTLATVFAPTLARNESIHPQQEIQDNRAKTLVTELLFRNYEALF